MPRGDKTTQIKLYKLTSELPEECQGDVTVFLELILENANGKIKRENERYRLANNLDLTEFEGLQGCLYFNKFVKSASYLPQLLQPICADMRDYLDIYKHTFSYVLFLWRDTKIFAISGGQGHNVIDSFLDRRFGYAFLTYIGKADYKVKASAQKSVTGPVMANSRYFRGEIDISTEDNFGKSFDELNVAAKASRIVEIFDLELPERRKEIGCSIKSGLLIKKKVGIKKVISVAKLLMDIDLNADEFISLQYITESPKNRPLLTALQDKLWHNLAENCFWDINNGIRPFSFDIMHYNIGDFTSAVEYDFLKSGDTILNERIDDLNDIDVIYGLISERLDEHTDEAFRNYMSDVEIISFGQDNEIYTEDLFINHIYCEMEHENKLYFRLDGNWSVVEDRFKEKLQQDFNYCIQNYVQDAIFDSRFNPGESEDVFINRISCEQGVFRLHKLYPDGRHEFCDILKIGDDSKLYIVHLKVGDGVKIRELTQQVELSMKRYSRCKADGDNGYFKSVFNSLIRNNRTNGVSEDEFLDLFRRDPVFVALICVSNPDQLNIDSCIAQYSIVELLNKKNILGWPISICFG